MKAAAPVLVLALLATGCVSTRSQELGLERFPAQDEHHPIPVFDTLADITVPVEKVAVISAEGAPLSSWKGVVRHLKAEARAVGADAIVLRDDGLSPVGTLGFGRTVHANLFQREKHMSVLAVRFVAKDEQAVRGSGSGTVEVATSR